MNTRTQNQVGKAVFPPYLEGLVRKNVISEAVAGELSRLPTPSLQEKAVGMMRQQQAHLARVVVKHLLPKPPGKRLRDKLPDLFLLLVVIMAVMHVGRKAVSMVSKSLQWARRQVFSYGYPVSIPDRQERPVE